MYKVKVQNLRKHIKLLKKENDSTYLRMDLHRHNKIIDKNETIFEEFK